MTFHYFISYIQADEFVGSNDAGLIFKRHKKEQNSNFSLVSKLAVPWLSTSYQRDVILTVKKTF